MIILSRSLYKVLCFPIAFIMLTLLATFLYAFDNHPEMVLITGILMSDNKTPIVGQTVYICEITKKSGDELVASLEVEWKEGKYINPNGVTNDNGLFEIKVNHKKFANREITVCLQKPGISILRKGGVPLFFKIDSKTNKIDLGVIIVE